MDFPHFMVNKTLANRRFMVNIITILNLVSKHTLFVHWLDYYSYLFYLKYLKLLEICEIYGPHLFSPFMTNIITPLA